MLFAPSGFGTLTGFETNAPGRPIGPIGTTFTPAIGSKGSWTELIAATSGETFMVVVSFHVSGAASTSRNIVADIGIGGSGSEVVLIPDLIASNVGNYTDGLYYYFPVRIPAGSRVVVRGQSTASNGLTCYIRLHQDAVNPESCKAGFSVEAVGLGTIPEGTLITPGTTSEGSWFLLGTTTQDNWWWQVSAQVPASDTSHLNCNYHIDLAVGDGTTFRNLMTDVLFITTAAEQGRLVGYLGSCEYPVPSGSNIYARAQGSAAVEDFFVIAYGVGE